MSGSFPVLFSTLKTLAALAVLLAGCTSSRPDPRTNVAAETPPLDVTIEARALVDSLSAAHLKEWTEGVEEAQPGLKSAVKRELARRAIAVSEADEADKPAPLHKEVEAIRMLTPLPPDPAPAEFIDYTVWAAAHQGRGSFDAVWALGPKALPSILKLRNDKHPLVLQAVGYLVAEYVGGSQRWKSAGDEAVTGFCTAELTRCPEDCKPHYRALLAAMGTVESLDAFPTLLKAQAVGDQIAAHLVTEAMFAAGSPYAQQELKKYALGKPQDDVWRALSQRALEWWEKNRDRLSYDAKLRFWVLQK